MRIRDWDQAQLKPAFGHEGHWLMELLEAIDAREIAAYCMHETLGRRLLVATDLGLVDVAARDPATTDRIIPLELVPWQDVQGVGLTGAITMDEALRHERHFALRVRRPQIEIADAPNSAALVSFARTLVLRAGRAPQVRLEEPEV